ncbi:TonB-dependent receptor [uncultured Acinetobacter sp.]|uniref:TonB-dependent receptor family protein n=1 Tax=uncultured Acinetobacter sp. TaxID=165433 RepID=UPI00263798AB|nr:TonB-dependent receptor [uncultured Acinetobacter sp.]
MQYTLHFKQHLLTVVIMMLSQEIYAENLIELDTLLLQANTQTEVEKRQQQFDQLVGAHNFIQANDQQRLQSNADMLKLEAGVYAQSAGNEGVKISIRGSGINRGSGAHGSGTTVLLDNIALTGPGGTPYELLEPGWLSYVEILRGSQGFEQGALALGGVINYVSHTGKTQQSQQLSVATGSHGYQKYQLSMGQDLGPLDYYVAATHSQSQGQQQHSQNKATGISANLGYQINDQLHTRLYLRARETAHQTPGRLTQQQIQKDPQQANPYQLSIDAQRVQPGSTWLAHQTTWQLSQGGMLQASLAYHDYPMDLQESLYRIQVDYRDLTGHLNWQQPFTWQERDHLFKLNLRTTNQHNSALGKESLRFDTADYAAGTLSRRYVHRGQDHLLNLQHELHVHPQFWWITGIGALYSKRDSYVTQPSTDKKLKQQRVDYAYRLGMRYDMSEQTQWYATLSRSVEPAHAWSMLWGSDHYFSEGNGPATGRQEAARRLKTQTAHSFEVGGHGQYALGEWSISYYYSQLENELLMVQLQPNPHPVIAESNASATIHQGLEIALNTPLWQSETGGLVSLKQAYTLSDFYYQNDPLFKNNQLAGLPRHYYQAHLKYQHPKGWWLGLNTEYASAIPIDYANTHQTDAYQIWGIQAAWPSIWSNVDLWLEAKNLTQQKYSATITPGFNDMGQDHARATPGEARAIYTGINYRF